MAMGAAEDGTPPMLARAHQVTVMALGIVLPGAIVLADSRRCAAPGCSIEFVPAHPRQVCCSPECKKARARLLRKARKAKQRKPLQI